MSMTEAQRDVMIGHHRRRVAELEQENAGMAAKLAAVEWLSWNCCNECGSLIRAALNVARNGQA